ncbi:EamA family transporter, partial [Glaesserella parasuis]|nr:EamA family transporter [Glaesserella parasuis]
MKKGITFPVTASILFGVLYYLSTHLKPLSGEEIYGFRMWVSLPFVISALFIFKKNDEFNRYLKRLKQHPHLILVLLTTTAVT